MSYSKQVSQLAIYLQQQQNVDETVKSKIRELKNLSGDQAKGKWEAYSKLLSNAEVALRVRKELAFQIAGNEDRTLDPFLISVLINIEESVLKKMSSQLVKLDGEHVVTSLVKVISFQFFSPEILKYYFSCLVRHVKDKTVHAKAAKSALIGFSQINDLSNEMVVMSCNALVQIGHTPTIAYLLERFNKPMEEKYKMAFIDVLMPLMQDSKKICTNLCQLLKDSETSVSLKVHLIQKILEPAQGLFDIKMVLNTFWSLLESEEDINLLHRVVEGICLLDHQAYTRLQDIFTQGEESVNTRCAIVWALVDNLQDNRECFLATLLSADSAEKLKLEILKALLTSAQIGESLDTISEIVALAEESKEAFPEDSEQWKKLCKINKEIEREFS